MKTRILAMLLAVVMAVSLAACTSSDSRSSKTATCGACGRTYEAGDSGGNYMSIARTHMCKNCSRNYKSMQEALGK